MIDPLAMESLEHVDALYLGLIFPSTLTPGTWHQWEERVAFAKQLNHGPWAQVVRRLEIARQARLQRLFWAILAESYLGSWGTKTTVQSHFDYIADHTYERDRLMGVLT